MTKILQIISKCSRISVFSFPYIRSSSQTPIYQGRSCEKTCCFLSSLESRSWKATFFVSLKTALKEILWNKKKNLLFSSKFWGRSCKMTFSIKVLSRSCKITCGFHTHLGVLFHKSSVIVFTHIIKRILWKNVAFTQILSQLLYILANAIAGWKTGEYEVSNNFDASCC